jgi:exopolysaccharide biosynthesis polyprenyl glycosylphosphotransferase
MIPGELPTFRDDRKKPAESVRPLLLEKVLEISAEAAESMAESSLALRLPSPLQGRLVWTLQSMAADFALAGLNWLWMVALLTPLHSAFPRVQLFAFDADVRLSLLRLGVLQAALIPLVGRIEGLYIWGSDLRRQARILGLSVLSATALSFCAYRLQAAAWTASAMWGVAGLLNFGGLWIWRWHNRRREQCDLRSGVRERNVLIVGAGGVGRRVASYLERHPETGRTVRGFLDNDRPLGDGVIGQASDLPRLARARFVEEVILAAPSDGDLIHQVLNDARRLRLDLEIVPDLFGCKLDRGEAERIGDLPVICLHTVRLPEASLALKRLVDVVGAAFGLLVLSPVLVVIAALIKLDSPGPLLYRAPRAGRKARPFRCLKFRTMVSNADDLKRNLRQDNQRFGPMFKIVDDPRITRLGHFLRRYSLDELPQLWNVVKGEMSLVGPRPHTIDDFAAYQVEHLARLDVTPGITGLWQVMARRNPSFECGLELDREYIRTWSLRADLRILLKTLRVVAQGSGD